MNYLVLISLISYVFGETVEEISENLSKKNAGFLFSMPKFLISGKNETVCISIHEASIPAKAIVDIKWKNNHFPTTKLLESENSCFDLYVPTLNIKEPQYVGARVQVQLNGIVQSSHNQDPILMYSNQLNKTFIDTDRGIYKPGDKVKFRVLVLDDKHLPLNNKISEIRIKNPLDITVAIWEDVTPESGLIQLEYQMVQESLIGKWKIEITGTTKTFDVFKHVLPRFKIDVQYPKLVYFETNSITIKVCAQYSFGKSVNGNAFIKITDSHNNMEPIVRSEEMDNGCAEFPISKDELGLSHIKEKFAMYDPKIYLHITATVTERGTNKIHIATGKSLISMMAYTMKIIGEQTFQSGLPYKGKIQISNINSNFTNEVIEICYNIAIKKSWNYLNNEQCSNFLIGSNNSLDFSVLPLKSNIIHIHIKARSLNHTNIGDSFLAIRLFSPSSSYIILEQNVQNIECKTHQQFTVFYTTDAFVEKSNVTFYYMIKSYNKIYKLRKVIHPVRKTTPDYLNELQNIIGEKTKFVKLGVGVDKFILNFKIDKTFISKYQLLVYYVSHNGETVSATKNINIRPCLLKVEAKWSQNQITPGDLATLNIKTDSDALCSISSVDKSTTFLANNHQIFNINTFLKSFSEERESPISSRKTCVPPTKKNVEASSLSLEPQNNLQTWDLRKRKKRYVYSFSEDFDAYDTFNKFGTIIITNLKIVTKPCYNGPLLKETFNHVEYIRTGEYDEENVEKTAPIRYLFPKTWLWDLVPVSNLTQIRREIPHTITNWVTNVLCVSQTEGVGFSKELEITTFQPFFVDVLTPYSIKREETLYLYVNIFNYLSYKFPIKITLDMSDGLKLSNPQEKLSASYCLQKNNTATHIFTIKGTKMGLANISVIAEVDNQFPAYCGPETIVSKRDVVIKSILVEPEGYPVTITKSVLLCASESQTSSNVSWELSVPQDVVEGTDKAYINLNGDLLGQTIENLEDLLNIPSGCGEQIMASVAPNLYAMKYLSATNKLTASTRQRIIRNLKMGYQRIMNYVHKDGSFSAFGYHDPSGSMFLTVFVVRTLQEAKPYIYVDQRVIDKAVAWIFNHQLENGCFNTMHHVFQDMGGTSTENSTAGLTAYVMVSLIEAQIKVPKSVQTNAKYCIRSQHNPDKYTMAISSYALFMVDWNSEATRLLERLMSMANQQNNMMWWSNKDNNESTASDIEVTSYILLSLLHQNTSENLANAHSIIRWLSTKSGPRGGFKSTQDTVVTLDALAKYSTFFSSRKLDLKIHIEANDQRNNEIMKLKDRLISKRVQVDEPNSNIKINVKGEGCILAQAVLTYYIKNIPRSEAFKLALEVSPVSNIDKCSVASLSSCLAYIGPDSQSNMAVLEVTLPSGYEADRASLHSLIEGESKVKMFEEIRNQVILYFTKLDSQQICISFNINENSLVETRTDSSIKLYDYYKPEFESLQFYTMNTCLFNESLAFPEITVKPLSKTIKTNDSIIDEKLEKIEEKLDNHTSENIVKRDINPDFVNMDFEMDMPKGNEGNIPMYTKPDLPRNNKNPKGIRKVRSIFKREVNNQNFNTNFKDMDVEMQLPSGMEGNVPWYTNPDLPKNNVAISKIRSSNGNQRKNTNLNTKFVDKDVEMQPPNGMEGNVPWYTNPDLPKNNVVNRKIRSELKQEKNSNLNPKFVDKDTEMQPPNGNEGNTPMYTIPDKQKNETAFIRLGRSLHKKTVKREASKLNPKFVDMNVEMQLPNGIEGNRPMYVNPNSTRTGT